MNILCSIHLYPPTHLCGAEFMLHAINKHLQSKGHEIKVLLHQANHYKIENHYVYDEVDVFPPEQNTIQNLFLWADVVVTHLDYTGWTIGAGSIYNKPVVHLIHNTHTYRSIADSDKKQYIVYNSEWAKGVLGYKHKSIVVHPSVDWRFYDVQKDTEKNEFITMINLDHNKGGHILKAIAERMPHKKFIGVKGSYSEPAKIGQYTNQPSNVTVLNKTDKIKEVYEKTRVLIMPSEYESWGRTATESMCSGIPVICTPTPGLLENCGSAGTYIQNRDNIDDWVKAIEKLDSKKEYSKASKKAKERSRELDPRKELDELELWIREVKNDYK
jgi:glycosyltransferase involved in cell wall biosynthesis